MSGNDRRRLELNVPALTRVEGEGALELKIRDGRIDTVRLAIFEPPRYFEKFLEGRDAQQVIDTVARICGICPVAYQMSAVQAIEQAYGLATPDWVERMRRVFYCGEWLQSHSLHIHLLALPDLLGYDSAIAMAEKYPDQVRRGLLLQGLGNALVRLFGGRSVHPVGVLAGGFHQAPSPQQVTQMLDRLESALFDAEALLQWVAGLPLPDDDQDFTCVSLRHPNEYPMYRGRITSSAGLDIAADEYEQYFEERQQAHSTALYAYLRGEPYLVGPLARLNLNLDRLPRPVSDALAATGIRWPSRNMFHSMLARAVEILVAMHEAIRLLRDYRLPESSRVEVIPGPGVGFGATEAPRGLLWHRYAFDRAGRVSKARIVPPTSQNQARIEQDLRLSLQAYGLQHQDDQLRLRSEMVIRNYDPCISCATHFLRLKTERV